MLSLITKTFPIKKKKDRKKIEFVYNRFVLKRENTDVLF